MTDDHALKRHTAANALRSFRVGVGFPTILQSLGRDVILSSVTVKKTPTEGLSLLTLAAILTALAIGSSAFVGITYCLTALSPTSLVFLRTLIASSWFGLGFASGRLKLPPRRTWPGVIVVALIGITTYQLTLVFAQTSLSPGAASVVLTLVPGVTAGLATVQLGERLTARAWGGLGLAFAGALLITLNRGEGFTPDPMALVILIAVLASSAHAVYQKPLLRRMSPEQLTGASVLVGMISLLPFAPLALAEAAAAPWPILFTVFYLGSIASTLGYLLWTWALARATAGQVVSFVYLQPILASGTAWLLLGDRPTLTLLIGGLGAIAGIFLVNTSKPTASSS